MYHYYKMSGTIIVVYMVDLYLFVCIECGAVQRDSNGAFSFTSRSPMSSAPCEWIVGSQTTLEVIVIIDWLRLYTSGYVLLCEKAEIHSRSCSRVIKRITRLNFSPL